MSTEVLAIIAATIVSAIISGTGLQALLARLRTVEQAYTALMTKMDLLWGIYAEDAIKEARSASLMQKNSPLQFTPRWEEVLPDWLKDRIKWQVKRYNLSTKSAYDTAFEVFSSNLEDLTAVSRTADIKMQALLGGIYHLAREEQDKDE